jgi:hypothetical protein
VSGFEERGPRRYRLLLAAAAGENDDVVVIAALRALLDLGVAPRAVTAGNSLEEFFLQVTGANESAN